MATVVAVMAPVLLGAAGLAIDTTLMSRSKSAMQNATDAASLAAAKELLIPGATDAQIESVFRTHFFTHLGIQEGQEGSYVIKVKREPGRFALDARAEYHWKPFVAQLIDKKATPIVTSAKAELAGSGLTCLIGLLAVQAGVAAKASLDFGPNSKLEATGCSIYANSTDKASLKAQKKAQISAFSICSAGGVYRTGKPTIKPEPVTDCPEIEDPLALRPAPPVGACDENGLALVTAFGTKTRLKPGVYCGGLAVSGEGEVELDPGVYVIKDGPLVVEGKVEFHGKGVGFYLTGLGSVISMKPDTMIDLSAAESGPLAGLLVHEDRSVPFSFVFNPKTYEIGDPSVRLHRISSNRANNLLGTIYTPRSILTIDATAPVADKSAYTALIVGRLWLQKGPTLTLNADYTKTKVPVPEGLIGAKPKLVH